jgi:hypothetical protein
MAFFRRRLRGRSQVPSLLRNSPITILRGWIADEKPTFYEQVTGVKVLFFAFSFIGLLFLLLFLGFVALHRVSIRTLDELS